MRYLEFGVGVVLRVDSAIRRNFRLVVRWIRVREFVLGRGFFDFNIYSFVF